jgi:hypothetical protein
MASVYLTFLFAHCLKESLDIVALRNNIAHDQIAFPLPIILVGTNKLGRSRTMESLARMNEFFLLNLLLVRTQHLSPKQIVH